MPNRFLSILTFFMCFSIQAYTLDLDLYINSGEVTLGEYTFTCVSFNEDDQLNSKNKSIYINPNEVLNLTLINNDNLVHNFTIDDILESDNTVNPGESIELELTFSEEGTFRYYSSYSYGQYAGASGMIIVGYQELPQFAWNLFDLSRSLSFELANNTVQEIPSDYQPELFFINGVNHPLTLEDPETLVTISLGDEAIISVVNSGYMDHVLHFHGFHVEILSSQIQGDRVGWIKDTIPLKSGDAMTFRLVADQPGIYPVHDHNLIAVTNIGLYPGGMLTQIHVAE